MDIVCTNAKDVSQIGYTFYNEARNVCIYIDYFFVSGNMLDTVENVRVIENAENFSDHHLITVCFGLPISTVLMMYHALMSQKKLKMFKQ